MSPVKHLDHLNLTVADLATTERWYAEVFGFRRVEGGVHRGHPWAILRAGEALLCVYEHPRRPAPDSEGAHRVNHFGLRITDAEDFLARAEAAGVEVRYGGVVEWPHSRSWYVADPTGYEIEVAAWRDDTVRFGAAVQRT